MITYDWLPIGGEHARPASERTIELLSANTEQSIGQVPEATHADVDAAVDAARRALHDRNGWSSFDSKERGAALDRLADEHAARAGEITKRVAMQNGMPVTIAGQLEAALPETILRYYAQLTREMQAEETRAGMLGGPVSVRRSPVGVVAGIVPWNYPQLIYSFKVGAALAAGCPIVLKPSPGTLLDAYQFADAVAAAGIPAGMVNIVPADRDVGSYLVSHPGVDKVSFTGSTAAGKQIGEACGQLLRPVTLELGGKSAAILLDDVDLDASLDGLFQASLLNNGQTCVANGRILVPRSRYDDMLETLTAFVKGLTVGDSLDPNTQIGPLASAVHRDRVESYIAKGRAEGARLVAGGGRPDGLERGWFVDPTLFADVDPRATIAQEEIFGPVLAVLPYDDLDDAVALANDTEYGLAGTIWTSDPDRAAALSKRIESGTVGVNYYLPDPVAPFGGMKSSGLGRELGPESVAQNQTIQSVYYPAS